MNCWQVLRKRAAIIFLFMGISRASEADSALGYLAAVVGILPGLGDEAGAFLKGADKALKAGDLETASKLINKASNEIEAVARPSHRQSELDVGKDLGDGWREQVSFKDGKEVPYGTKGGVRPDWCQGNVCSVEVKNYNITTNKNGLINNVAKQAVERQKNLPAGMRQEVVIDIRGQKSPPFRKMQSLKGLFRKPMGQLNPQIFNLRGNEYEAYWVYGREFTSRTRDCL